MQRAVVRRVGRARDDDLAVAELDVHVAVQRLRQLAARALHAAHGAVELHLHTVWDGNRLLAYARHRCSACLSGYQT